MSTEKIIETKICKLCGANFDITDKDLEFYDKISPTFSTPVLKKFNIPAPTLCPDCRQQRRLAFRNERKLYKRKCDLSGKEIISIYSPDKPYKIYNQKEGYENRNPFDYGRDFDFNKGFFEQFASLMKEVPYMNLSNSLNEGADYNNDTQHCKNTYLCFFSNKIENSYYINGSVSVFESVDIGWSKDVQNCYECFNCGNIYKCFYCFGCNNIADLHFCYNCTNCKNCFGCVGLDNKSYCLYNEQLDKNQYNEQIENILEKENVGDIKQKVLKLKEKLPVNYSNMENSNNCVGDYIYWSNNCLFCYEVDTVNNGKYLSQCARANDIYSCDNTGNNGSLLLENMGVYDSFGTVFSLNTSFGRNVFYSDDCYNSSNLFGCIGLSDVQYCILNKQYTKEEYEKLVSKIIQKMQQIGEWGEFFPPSISPFGYNETVAFENFPLSKEEVIKQGFKWSDYEPPFPKVEKIIPAKLLPKDIKDIPDDILNWAIECEVTKKLFRIIKQELEFYRKHNLPIPKKHPDQRHLDRMNTRNP
ncbi:MAG: hypothetical protein PHO80_01340, partial [Candidatus Gracilibacteria bacterium]|nr:hypothetical protein [Candidatus Gracilibacteria bacterium]